MRNYQKQAKKNRCITCPKIFHSKSAISFLDSGHGKLVSEYQKKNQNYAAKNYCIAYFINSLIIERALFTMNSGLPTIEVTPPSLKIKSAFSPEKAGFDARFFHKKITLTI